MGPKKAKETTSPSRVDVRNLVSHVGPLIVRLICSFYLLVVRYTGEGIHEVLQAFFGMIREVIKILLVLVARVLSEICFGVALIVEKILAAILHLLLQLVLKAGSFINQIARGLVDQAGYGISSVVFITVTVLIWWFIAPVLENIHHAVIILFP